MNKARQQLRFKLGLQAEGEQAWLCIVALHSHMTALRSYRQRVSRLAVLYPHGPKLRMRLRQDCEQPRAPTQTGHQPAYACRTRAAGRGQAVANVLHVSCTPKLQLPPCAGVFAWHAASVLGRLQYYARTTNCSCSISALLQGLTQTRSLAAAI
jgi:hypothetical protein